MTENPIQELREMIAVSLYVMPCNVVDLMQRDFLKNKSRYGVDHMLQRLDSLGATFYTNTKSGKIEDEVIHIKKSYMKKS